MSLLSGLHAQFFNASLMAINGTTAASACEISGVKEEDLVLSAKKQLQTSGEGTLELLPQENFALARIVKGQTVRMDPEGRSSVETSWLAQSRLGRNGSRPTRRHELSEDRAAQALEKTLKNFPARISESRIGKWLKKMFWDPKPLEGSAWKFHRDQLLDGKSRPKYYSQGNFMHRSGNPITERILEIVGHLKRPSWSQESRPYIAELGAGDGNLATLIAQRTGAFVLELDFLEGLRPSAYRLVGDLCRLPIKTAEMPVVVSSFSLEYAGEEAFREAHRILQRGGSLVALVHHKNSSISLGHPINRLLYRIVVGGYRLAAGFRPFRALLPTFLRNYWKTLALLMKNLDDAGFSTRDQVRDLLKRVGFVNVQIEVGKSPPIMNPRGSARLDTGWIIIATKGKK